MEQEQELTGTTILAFKYEDGIMFAADSRTTRGQFVACHYSDKITQLADNILCCRCGVASQTQWLQRYAAKEIKKLAYLEKTGFSISKAANLVGRLIYENKDVLRASLIMGGVDNGFEIYKIALDGTVIPTDATIAGSGSAFIYGMMDSQYRPNMPFKEAIEFATTLVRLAINRDCSSGGVVRVATIEKDKTTRRYLLEGDKVFME
ncbi:Proteasome subunit beta type [Enterospora canceri]|uniref:proteasome endopeptidase complex n=1 Tax=Enterospora canceri TaxID=1081671 RepID=A0A1Y1SA92_9MICR|nr:Proteasome subunit beta type [Enterospora canceri]